MALVYTITALAKEFQLTTRAIRHYEDEGLLQPVREGSNRLFSHRDRVRLKLALRCKRLKYIFTIQAWYWVMMVPSLKTW